MPIARLRPSFIFTEGHGSSERVFQQYFADPGPDVDQDNWRTANLLAAPPLKSWQAIV